MAQWWPERTAIPSPSRYRPTSSGRVPGKTKERTLTFPGAGHLYRGSAVVGFVLLLTTLWAALQGLVLPWALPALHLPQPAEDLFALAAGLVVLACYGWSVRARKKGTA